jgi:hypothetical protein
MRRHLRHDHTEFRQMRAQGVDQARPLAHQQVACPVHQQQGLLLLALDRTNRIEGRATASQIAAASAMSFFCRRT